MPSKSNCSKRSYKVPDEVLQKLEDRITSRILGNIQAIIVEKCKDILGENLNNEQDIFSQGRTNFPGTTNDNLTKVQNKIKILHDKTDQALGSLSYLVNEYDDLLTETKKLVSN